MLDLGKFKITSNNLWVSDPCYDKVFGSKKGSLHLENVKNGSWNGLVDILDCKNWGRRVRKLVAEHESYTTSKCDSERYTLFVDSGQMGIFDFSQFPNNAGEYNDETSLYKKICNITLKDKGGILDFGCVSRSGFGDGSYDCYVYRFGTEVVKIEIEFISDEEAEEF